MNNYPTYSVSIRTLGTAGEKYQETLNSVARQTVKPEKVLVYIPHGYALPKETIGIEEYVRCDKGMVTQRSQPFDEITSEYILFLDDDLSFEADFVKKLFDGLLTMDGDCISPDIYRCHENNWLIKVRDYLGGTKFHFKKDWSFIIRNDSHYSYNNNPKKKVLLSQSGAGASYLCRKTAYQSIHFEDERWMETYPYACGDDQLFFYKLYLYGFKVLTSFDTEILHLDAGAGHLKDKTKFNYYFAYLDYIIWRRSVFEVKTTKIAKLWSTCCYSIFYPLRGLPITILRTIKHRSFIFFIQGFKAMRDARKYTKSEEYKSIPKYLHYKL